MNIINFVLYNRVTDNRSLYIIIMATGCVKTTLAAAVLCSDGWQDHLWRPFEEESRNRKVEKS